MGLSIQQFADKAAFLFLVLFGVLLPYDMLYATIALYPLILFTFIGFQKNKWQRVPKVWWIFSILFLLTLVGYTYTTNIEKAAYLIERQLLLCLFPLLLPLVRPLNRDTVNTAMRYFSLSCIAAILFLLFKCLQLVVNEHLPLSALLESRFYNHSFTAPIGIHATYLSLYVALCILFLIEQIPELPAKQKVAHVVGILILSIGLYFLAARNTTLSLLFILAFIFPLFKLRRKFLYFLCVLGVMIVALFAVRKSTYIKNRFSTDIVQDLGPKTQATFDNPEPRITRWRCAADIIARKPIWGHGAGDEIPLLKKCYEQKNMSVSYALEFNTHNQYLAILIRNGAIGLLAVVLMFAYLFRLAIVQRDFLYCAFLVLIVIGFVTENIIDANKGIFFFALFNTMLGYAALYERKRKLIYKTSETA